MKKFATLLLLGIITMTTNTSNAQQLEKATFAGGCFWCVEPPFDATTGVVDTLSGYMGGTTANPTYEEVSSGNSGHAEVVQVTYDPRVVSYEQLVQIFWRNIDPTVENRQFCDVGTQYRTAVFYHNDEQKEIAERTKLEASKRLEQAVKTEITPASEFYVAEDYHQDFYKKNPIRYTAYKMGCKREHRLNTIWKDWKPVAN